MRMRLNGDDWILTGWNRHQWQFSHLYETGGISRPVVAPIPAKVPGAVQQALHDAGLLEDWNIDLNFLHAEWVEHREWMMEKTFSVDELPQEQHSFLEWEGLDYSGLVFLNDQQILSFIGMHCPYIVDVTKHLRIGKNSVRVVLLQPPEVDGQVGYTSRTTVLKSRYNYGWDWMPRMVNIGIFGDVWLRTAESALLENVYPRTSVEETVGLVDWEITVKGLADEQVTVHYSVTDGNTICAEGAEPFILHENEISSLHSRVAIAGVRRWHPADFGEQALYTARVWLENADGRLQDEWCRRIGFREIEYRLPEGAAANHFPYSLWVNGEWVPVKGVNWAPLSPFYGTVTEQEYRTALESMRRMHVNLLRVWGGALEESECFYRLCDEMGFLVWQEFPQSSSGIDNACCNDPAFLEKLREVAVCYIKRRRHHACLCIWCGGNELYDPDYRPQGTENANLRLLSDTVKEYDSERLFLPASPSGPVANWGPSVPADWCGDTHGPWTYEGIEGHYDRFNRDSSLLHSEIGAAACPRLETLLRCAGSRKIWPFNDKSPYWVMRGAWWIFDKELRELFGEFSDAPEGLDDYVRAYRFLQMEALRYAVVSVRRAGRKKSGAIIWMADEPFPNSANTSLLEYDGCPRPAYYKVRQAYATASMGLLYRTPAIHSGDEALATVVAFSDRQCELHDVRVDIFGADGHLYQHTEYGSKAVPFTADFGRIQIPALAPWVLVRLMAMGIEPICEEYVFTVDGKTPFGSLLRDTGVQLATEKVDGCTYKLTNTGSRIALYIDCIAKNADGRPMVVQGAYRCLCPGEEILLTTSESCDDLTVYPLNRDVH